MIWLLACVAEVPDSGKTESDSAVYFEATPLTAEWSANDVESAIRESAERGLHLPVDTVAWVETLIDDLSTGTGTCPQLEPSADVDGAYTSYWYGECLGQIYELAGDWQVQLFKKKGDGSSTYSASELHSFTGTALANGSDVGGGGFAWMEWQASDAGALVTMGSGGHWVDGSRSDALAEGVSAALDVGGAIVPEVGFVGDIIGITGTSEAPVELALTYVDGCAGGAGQVRVRDPSSGWWEITLDEDCSGCGNLSFAGNLSGTACVGSEIRAATDAVLSPYLEVFQ